MTSVQHRWYSANTARKSSGSSRDASAVDPTRPQDITVSCRRSVDSGCALGCSSDWCSQRRLDRRAVLSELRREFVPFAKHSNNKPRHLGVRLDLSPEPPNQYIDAAIIGLSSTAECGIEQLITRQHSAGVAGQHDKQRKLGTRQRHLVSVAVTQRAPGQVDGKAIEGQNLRLPAAPQRWRLQNRLYSSQHLLLVQGYERYASAAGVRPGEPAQVLWPVCDNDQLAALLTGIEDRRPGA